MVSIPLRLPAPFIMFNYMHLEKCKLDAIKQTKVISSLYAESSLSSQIETLTYSR
jgi:hypothetical protein